MLRLGGVNGEGRPITRTTDKGRPAEISYERKSRKSAKYQLQSMELSNKKQEMKNKRG